MKKKLFVLALTLILALPLLGLAQDAATPEAEDQTTAAPYGNRRGRGAQEAPADRFQDENEDGLCDLCGQKPGENKNAPGFVDENGDGQCDHFGTDEQYQGRSQNFGRGRSQRQMGCSGQCGQGGRGQGRRMGGGRNGCPRMQNANPNGQGMGSGRRGR